MTFVTCAIFVIWLPDRNFSCLPVTSLILTRVANSRPATCHMGLSWVTTLEVHGVRMFYGSVRPNTNVQNKLYIYQTAPVPYNLCYTFVKQVGSSLFLTYVCILFKTDV